jgi:hypothetical protein
VGVLQQLSAMLNKSFSCVNFAWQRRVGSSAAHAVIVSLFDCNNGTYQRVGMQAAHPTKSCRSGPTKMQPGFILYPYKSGTKMVFAIRIRDNA